MAHRHDVQAKARGGRAVYSGKGSNVEHEAEEKGAKRGGRQLKKGGRVPGFAKGGRLAKYARGGAAGGSDKHPFSSAGASKDDRGRTSHTVPTPGPK